MNEVTLERIRVVEQEYFSCRAGLTYAIREWPSVTLSTEWQGRTRWQAQTALMRLEDTYVIRLFSESEGILREYRLATETARMPITVEDLINRLGSTHRLTEEIRQGAHSVQYYRNALVHRGARHVPSVTFGEGRRALNRFLATLPEPINP